MKKILISILTLIFIISVSISVNAATTGSASLAISKDTVKAGDEFSVVLTATDTNNINTVEYTTIKITDESGKASSDITVKSVDAVSSNWYRETEGQSTYFVYSGEKTQSQQVFKVTFEVGSNVKEGTYKIDVAGIKVYSLNSEDDTTDVGTKTVSVKAIVDNTTAGNQGTQEDGDKTQTEEPENTTTTPSNTTNDGDKSNTTNTTNNKNTTSKKNTTNKTTTKLPQTGIENVSVIAIIVLGAISIASYASYRKYKNI